uniref:Uncharacterized protein n=1 Tax=Tanacetum cinerariifolium TaxID=118510 RepID=A0A6L2L3Y9_TANCI|nr:hypothetical protein [Tanacetum cinerariifolium]
MLLSICVVMVYGKKPMGYLDVCFIKISAKLFIYYGKSRRKIRVLASDCYNCRVKNQMYLTQPDWRQRILDEVDPPSLKHPKRSATSPVLPFLADVPLWDLANTYGKHCLENPTPYDPWFLQKFKPWTVVPDVDTSASSIAFQIKDTCNGQRRWLSASMSRLSNLCKKIRDDRCLPMPVFWRDMRGVRGMGWFDKRVLVTIWSHQWRALGTASMIDEGWLLSEYILGVVVFGPDKLCSRCDAVEVEAGEDIGVAKDVIEQVLFGSNKEDASASAIKFLEAKDELEVGLNDEVGFGYLRDNLTGSSGQLMAISTCVIELREKGCRWEDTYGGGTKTSKDQDVVDEYYHELVQVWLAHSIHKVPIVSVPFKNTRAIMKNHVYPSWVSPPRTPGHKGVCTPHGCLHRVPSPGHPQH